MGEGLPGVLAGGGGQGVVEYAYQTTPPLTAAYRCQKNSI
jgi:hypothetical protein